MKIPLSWLRQFVDLPESVDELRLILDDLGLVVEGIDYVGEGLEDVVIARIDNIQAIEGADRVRLVTVATSDGPLDIVCGATNFALGNHVPLAPVGAVLPGGFEIAERKMRGVTSRGMLCSARELGLSEDHQGLMILDEMITPVVGVKLLEALSITQDVVFDISVEGNRPDAWSVMGVARDLATRLGRALTMPAVASPHGPTTSDAANASIEDPELCGRLTVSLLKNVVVGPSPAWVAQLLNSAGMRPISNVVDASNLVMLELGQPTHPYDANKVAKKTLRARRALAGESLVTLDGVTRELAKAGRGLGDTGEDCVIVDGDNTVLGLAGVMGGASSEIDEASTEVLLEAAFFDPMTIARSSKRHGLRSEASNRFERGVDPSLALTAVARFVQVLKESCPNLEWLSDPLDVRGNLPEVPVIELREDDLERALGIRLPVDEVVTLLHGLNFATEHVGASLFVTPPTARLDIRSGACGRADVIEEIARLYSYKRLPRRTPSWPQPGRLSTRQQLRRSVRDIAVDLGVYESWTPTLGSDEDFDLLHAGAPRVRITNPLASEESVLRATMITGLVRAWGKNLERGTGDVLLGEIGMVFTHPDASATQRRTKGGIGGGVALALPTENERLTVVLGREGDDAHTAVAFFSNLAERLGLNDVVVRSTTEAPAGWHPTRCGELIDRASGARLGYVGEVDSDLLEATVSLGAVRRVGLVDIDLDVLADPEKIARQSQFVTVPSRYPSASIDLAFVTPSAVHAQDLALALRHGSDLVEMVELFDVYSGASLPDGTRSLAYKVRLGASDRTLSDKEIAEVRSSLIAIGESLGATLR